MKDGYHVTCTVSSNFLLDKGRVAENLRKECLLILLYFVNRLPECTSAECKATWKDFLTRWIRAPFWKMDRHQRQLMWPSEMWASSQLLVICFVICLFLFYLEICQTLPKDTYISCLKVFISLRRKHNFQWPVQNISALKEDNIMLGQLSQVVLL